ncbi:hypothetical protein CsatB_001383 [Cannabis sativa]
MYVKESSSANLFLPLEDYSIGSKTCPFKMKSLLGLEGMSTHENSEDERRHSKICNHKQKGTNA